MIGTAEERIRALDDMYPKWENHTLWTRFSVNAAKYKNEIFLIYQDEIYTYAQVLESVNAMARSFYAAGVKPGTHVAVFMYNCPEYLYAIFALAKLGAVKIPINMKLTWEEKKYILQQTETEFAIGENLSVQILKEELPNIKKVIPKNEKNIWDEFWQSGEDILESQVLQMEKKGRNPLGISDIMYTSGSTAFPKGVILTHDMLLRSSYASCRTRLMEEGRRLMIPIPFYHIFAYSEGILPILYVGGSILISNTKFEPQNVLQLMKKYQTNDIICVSTVMVDLLEKGHPNPSDYPSMHAAYWASTCPEWVWDAGKKAFGISDVGTGYGMTECGSTTTIVSPSAQKDDVKHYVGKLKDAGAAGDEKLQGKLLSVKICEIGKETEVSVGETGEILCKGLTVTPGYYKNEGANKKAFTTDGWFRTGDIGSVNSEGNLTFLGRVDDMYKINGENVSSQYLDRKIGQCSIVESVEVVGIRHDKYGEVGVAFVDVGTVTEEKKEKILAFCRNNLAGFQVPAFFIYGDHDKWPRTANGKVQKEKLREAAYHYLLNDKYAEKVEKTEIQGSIKLRG